MRLSVHIFAFGVLACGPAFCGQQAPSAGDEYRDSLKTLAASQEQKTSQVAFHSEDAVESYAQHLRCLAEGNDSSAESRCASRYNASEPAKEAAPETVAPPAPTKVPGEQSSLKPVSVNVGEVSTAQPTPAQTGTNEAFQATDCRDAYCQHLRSVAEGISEPAVNPDWARQPNLTTERNFVKNLAFDQMHIWVSPFQLRPSDATWALPFGMVTGALVVTDRDVSKEVATPGRLDISKKISNYGLYSFIGAGAGFYGLGLMTHDDHKRETGLLSGEAFINATLVAEALKLAVGRQRPFEGDHFGHIGRGGSSFPSEHAIGSFAIASVIAHEYPNPFIQIGAYALASTVAVTRVTAGQHFPSDVFVGGVLGYLIGRKMYTDHHNPELGGAEYGTFVRERNDDAAHSGSAYVPLDSWVYPVIDRLAAEGIIKSNFDSERPFTRLECARLVGEAVDNARSRELRADTQSLVDDLQQEFSGESEVWQGNSSNRSAELESVYTRVTEIAGPVLRDGYHFGQTLYNDYGRPYGRGFNEITGFSARATSGPLVFYFRGEYQHAPGNPDYSPQQKSQIATGDEIASSFTGPGTPQLNSPFPAENRFQVLDAYVGVNFNNNQLTLGPQSLWWGPGTGGAFMFTNNAEPLPMVRLNRVSPIEIPLLSKFLGPLRYDMFLGQTDGYHYILTSKGLLGPNLGTQPFVQGQRFTFKPTPNFEFGLAKTGVFGGTGYPLTAGYLFRTTFTSANYNAGDTRKPGDRRSGVDVTYRIPKLRDSLTWYAEAFSEDEVSPLFFPRMSAMRSGIYAATLPWLPRMDMRVEGVYTDVPSYGRQGYFYFNATYRNGFTKDGNIIGDWIGRDGRGVNASSRIWLSAKNSVQLGYREAVVDHEFLQGGRYQDFSVGASFNLRSNVYASAGVQYEYWAFPLLSALPQTNVSSSIQLTYTPDNLSLRSGGNK